MNLQFEVSRAKVKTLQGVTLECDQIAHEANHHGAMVRTKPFNHGGHSHPIHRVNIPRNNRWSNGRTSCKSFQLLYSTSIS